MNPLDDYPQIRKALYLVQWIIAGIMGILGIILTAQFGIDDLPDWYTITGLVLSFVWTYTGITAQGNVETSVDYNVDPDGEGDEDDELPLQPLF